MNRNGGTDTATGSPLSRQCECAWFDDRDKVIQNAIGNVFVKNALIAKALEIHFQAFQFDALLVGDVLKRQAAKVGLAGFGA